MAEIRTLQGKQQLIYDHVVGHYQRYLDRGDHDQLLLQVDGKADTGKSHLIRLLSSQL
jgi:hypothetical protein